MSDFYIEKILAKGTGKTDSVIELKNGLNIIQGRSNTGKTCIIKCIDFCFGSKTKPFDDSLGYDTIVLSIHTGKGSIQITRQFDKNQVDVITDVDGFTSGRYDLTKSKKKDPLPVLGDLLLASIGISEEHQIVKNKNFEKRRLTWRTFIGLMLFNVQDIAKETSVIEPEQATEKTAFLSALLFLLTGKDFAETDAKTGKEIRKAQKRAVEEYVNKKISAISEKKKALTESLAAFDGIDVEQTMQDIIDSLHRTEEEISDALKQSKDIFQQISELQERAAECALLQTRYAALRTQYVSDVKRLSFIVNGEVEIKKAPKNQTCPFCDGKLPERSKKSYIQSAQAELKRITDQMDGLAETEESIKKERADIEQQCAELAARRESIESMIAKELQPKAESFRESLKGYRSYIQIKNELSVIDGLAESWETDLRMLPNEDETPVEYHPKEYFGDDFQETIDKLIKASLTEACYDNLTAARFNMKNFDVEVNGHKKTNINGQGYCSYLNSIVAMVFRQYMSERAVYDPGILVIDTPLLGLDQGVSDAAPESMRTGLFKFFTKHQDIGQVIILENIMHIPALDYEGAGANVITFTKGLTEGRYGFLNDVK